MTHPPYYKSPLSFRPTHSLSGHVIRENIYVSAARLEQNSNRTDRSRSVGRTFLTFLAHTSTAPLTRLRAAEGSQAPRAMAAEYYTQRSSPGTLLITEATFIAKEGELCICTVSVSVLTIVCGAGGYPRAPGIYSSEQIEGWKAVAKGVHSKGGLIYCQLWVGKRCHLFQKCAC